jgi:RNA polymerase subunit RPABC4/transcription elongation factor Spt4
LVNCSNCGEKIADDANFCPKCGVKTAKGRTANVVYPSDELRDAFYSVGIELEKAFNIAARETHSAIQKAKDNWNQKPPQPETVACTNCNTKNPSGSVFCNSCGTKIASTEKTSGSG